MLPLPVKTSCPPAMAPLVHALLSSAICNAPTALSTYQFYDEVDAWLGPWGPAGYPIGYGKEYNILFASNPPLNRDFFGRKWVSDCAILLQEALRDYLVDRVKMGSLVTLFEPALREAAFDTHPKAYLDAGLLDVVEHSPELFLVICTIPYAQFNPLKPNFEATLKQVFRVLSPSGWYKLIKMIKAIIGMEVRSSLAFRSPLEIDICRFLWYVACSRFPGLGPLPSFRGARDDNFADRLGFAGGFINIFDR